MLLQALPQGATYADALAKSSDFPLAGLLQLLDALLCGLDIRLAGG
jgi:hypothetical protein